MCTNHCINLRHLRHRLCITRVKDHGNRLHIINHRLLRHHHMHPHLMHHLKAGYLELHFCYNNY